VLITNALVLVTVVSVASVASRVSRSVVEDRLVRDAAHQTARFLQTSRLPLSNRMMQDLNRIFGSHFAAVSIADQSILGTSLSPQEAEALKSQLQSHSHARDLMVGGLAYRVASHLVQHLDAAGEDHHPVRLFVLMPADQLEQTGQMAREQTWMAAAPAVIIATLLGIVFSLTITRPIRGLAREMDQIAAEHHGKTEEASPHESPGNLPTRGGPAEVAQLARSFDLLMDRLANTQEKLVRTQGLVALGKVAASAAHELKNPLSSIKMHLRILQDDPALDGRKDDIAMVVREIERMSLYLQELTDLAASGLSGNARLSSPPVNLEPVDLAAGVASVTALLEGRCRHAGVTVACDYHSPAPKALADPGRLRQCLMNLLINAIEAMPGGGQITVSTRPVDSGRVRLSVRDTGGGIRVQPPQKIFDLFYSTKHQSAGLGLHIVRQLILAQGGDIGCENLDQGASIWLDLPSLKEESHA
jgi:two-component system, NtrC family, sensor kinase